MTSDEAEEIMKPFFPHDSNLAMRSLRQAIQEEGNVPDWIIESIVMSYFHYKSLTEFEGEVEKLLEENTDKLGLNTLPYDVRFSPDEFKPNPN